jgi:hypothetical protein
MFNGLVVLPRVVVVARYEKELASAFVLVHFLVVSSYLRLGCFHLPTLSSMLFVTPILLLDGTACLCFYLLQGLCQTTMTGPGRIWLQSLSIDKMRKLFPPKVVSSGGDSSGGDTGGVGN